MNLFILDRCADTERRNSFVQEFSRRFSEIEIIDLNFPEDFNQRIKFETSILVIFFDCPDLGVDETALINDFLAYFGQSATAVPVACGDASHLNGRLAGIKALSMGEENALENLLRRVGAFLGLAVIPKDHQIFISYRATDGKTIADNLSRLLRAYGFRVWIDEARDEDNEGNLTCGIDVQDGIRNALSRSSLVVLIDTPDAPNSQWVSEEITFAHANLVPIIPVCIRSNGSGLKGSHFRSLASMQRYVSSDSGLSNSDEVLSEVQGFLKDIYLRKREIPRKVQEKFVSWKYSWQPVPTRRLIFESLKSGRMLKKTVLSHCPLYEGLHVFVAKNYLDIILRDNHKHNYKLLIYDGQLLREKEKSDFLVEAHLGEENICVVHHEEVGEFLGES